MAEISVGELALRIRADGGGSQSRLRADAERFARAVLEDALAQLNQRAGPRVVLIRELPLSWRVVEGRWNDSTELKRFVDAIVAALGDVVTTPSERPRPEADVAVFEDAAHRWADYLERSAHNEPLPWFHRELGGASARREIVDAPLDDGELTAALLHLLRRDCLELVLAAQTLATLRRLPRILDAARQPGVEAQRDGADPDRAAVAEPIAEGRDRRQLIAAIMQHVASVSRARTADGPVSRTAAPHADANGSRTASRERLTAEAEAGVLGADPIAIDGTAGATGGLLWLVNCLLELGVGEGLWKACLPESLVLAHAFGALVGDLSDPVVQALAGRSADRTALPVQAEQLQGVSRHVLPRLRDVFARRSLAEVPTLHVQTEFHDGRRILVARPPQSVFVMQAALVPDATSLRTEVDQIAAFAPTCTVHPALSRLMPRAPTGRLVDAPDVWFPPSTNVELSALMGVVVGWTCLLFAARVGANTSSRAAFVTRWLRRPVRIPRGAGEIRATFPARALDLEVRRAGLDRDPGELAWADTRLTFEFESEAV